MRLSGKAIVVTGSTRGIGRAIAEACAAEGARVVISSRRPAAVDEAVRALGQRGWQVTGLPADVSIPGDLERLLQHAIQTWGRVDVWVNNAGLSSGMRLLEDISAEEIANIVATNLTATMWACRLLIPYFLQQDGGILINMSGKGGRGDASPFLAVYAATKAAILSITRSLARENKDYPISIHAVLPGMVETDLYSDVRSSPRTAATVSGIPYVLKAVGVPIDVVGRLFVEIAAQEPGKETGRVYSLFKGGRLLRGIALLMWYRMTGRIR